MKGEKKTDTEVRKQIASTLGEGKQRQERSSCYLIIETCPEGMECLNSKSTKKTETMEEM